MNLITLKTFAYKVLVAFIYCFISTQCCNAALLVWDENSEGDLAGYLIYYGNSPGNYTVAVDVGNVTAYPLDDLDLHQDDLYYIAITAYDRNGNESNFSSELDYVTDDGIPYGVDNCPDTYNPDQKDTYPPQGNGIGDTCDCEADFDCDGYVDDNDVELFMVDFGRDANYHPCGDPLWGHCNGDFECDGDVDVDDVVKFLEDFGREQFNNPCPVCDGRDWCSY